jgi:hypothetical protein
MTLHERNRGTPRLQHDGNRLVVHGIRLDVAAFDTRELVAFAPDTAFENALDVLRLALRLQMLDDPMHFGVGNESPVYAERMTRAGRQIQHVALSEQCLGAHLIENRARIDLARDLKGDP